MHNEPNPETQNAMQDLCKKISVAHDLDDEIQSELYTHMEDKLLAYLNREETLSEQDAFLLVREHFGKPSAVKGLMQDAHQHEADVSLGRRLAAVLILTASLNIICYALASAILQWWPATHSWSGTAALLAVTSFLTAAIPWIFLRRWQRQLEAGQTPWFITLRPMHLLGCIAILFVLQPLVAVGLIPKGIPIEMIWSPIFWNLIVATMVASPVLQCMAWIWWCDRPPRQARAIGNAAGLWALWLWSASSISTINTVMGLETSWSNVGPIQRVLEALGSTFVVMVMYAFGAYAIYWILRLGHIGYLHWSHARR
jgi:hypothetical protein